MSKYVVLNGKITRKEPAATSTDLPIIIEQKANEFKFLTQIQPTFQLKENKLAV